jgi:thymidylate synthase
MSADLAYLDLLRHVLTSGRSKPDRTGTGTTSLFGLQFRHDMQQGFPLLTTKKLHTKSIIHELLWFLKGDTNVQYLRDNGVTIWDEWADEKGNLGPIYGYQWVRWGERKGSFDQRKGINQIQVALDLLRSDPTSRRILVTAWNPRSLKGSALPPCHYSFQLCTEPMTVNERWGLLTPQQQTIEVMAQVMSPGALGQGYFDQLGVPAYRLSLLWNQRSADLFLGLPFNIASYGFLLSMFAQQANMIPHELIGNIGDGHIYNNHKRFVEDQLERDPERYAPPRLELKAADSIFTYHYNDFQIQGYEAYPNWKNVPIAV